MNPRIPIALFSVALAFLQFTSLHGKAATPGWVVSWGQQVIPYSQPRTRYLAVEAGGYHSLARKSAGTLVTLGFHGYDLGSVPKNITWLTDISAGRYHNLEHRSDATVAVWGGSFYGPLTVPKNLSSIIAIAA